MTRPSSLRARSGGFSLIELLVSVVIGLVITLVLFTVLSDSEARKRTATSSNDAGQSGTYAAYAIDKLVRGSGSGYALAWQRLGGCRLNAQLPAATAERWPRTGALPAPFTALPQQMRLAPVVIFDGASDAGSDVLVVMSGAAGFAEAPSPVVPGSITAVQVGLPNSLGFRANDLVMLAGGGECLLTQVAAAKPICAGDPGGGTTQCPAGIPLGGTYYTAAGTFTSLAALGALADVRAFSIGNPTTNRPRFEAVGVGANSTLFSHDLLLLDPQNVSQPIAEGVRELHAVYGLDTNNDGILDRWQSPVAPDWDGPTLMNGTAASNARLRQIVAVRVGLIMRSTLVERDVVAPTQIRLFNDLPAANQVTVDLTRAGENRNQRHQPIEVTIPLRNLLMRTTS